MNFITFVVSLKKYTEAFVIFIISVFFFMHKVLFPKRLKLTFTCIFQTCGGPSVDPVTTVLPSSFIKQQSTRTSSPAAPGVTAPPVE